MISLVMAYYENPTMLQFQYAQMRKLPKVIRSRVSMVVVDDCSPDNPARPEDCGVDLQIYRIDHKVPWNQDAARNIGAKFANEKWLLLTDMDHVVPPETWLYLIEKELSEDVVYRFTRRDAPHLTPYKRHPNTWYMTNQMYWDIGGYDERFAGLYGTDRDFEQRIARDLAIVELQPHVIRYGREVIADASTTAFVRKPPGDKHRMKVIKKARRDKKPMRFMYPFHKVYPAGEQA